MHGLGDSADGWTDAAQMLAQSLKHIKFIIPTASPIPVTLNGGMRMNAWYDITGKICIHFLLYTCADYSYTCLLYIHFFIGLSVDRAAENCEGIEQSVSRIQEMIQSEVNLGILSTRICLAGFSQGIHIIDMYYSIHKIYVYYSIHYICILYYIYS